MKAWVFSLFSLLLLLVVPACNLSRPGAVPTPSASTNLATTVPSPVLGTPSGPQVPVETPQSSPSAPLPAPQMAGLSVVYIKDQDIWLWKEGQSTRLTQTGGIYLPDFSPDGRLVAYLRRVDDFHVELWVIDAAGSHDRKLVSVADLDTIGASVRDPSAVAINPYHFEWVPGTHQLAFNTHQVFQGAGLSINDDFNRVDADSGQLTFVLLAGWGGEFALSPDGVQVALSTPTNIILADLDGANWRNVLTYEPVLTYTSERYYARPRWSADSNSLYVAIPPTDPLADPPQPTALWRIPADGNPAQQVGSVPAVPYQDTPVSFSPDLASLIYLQEIGSPAENRRELRITRPDGSGGWAYAQGYLLQFHGWAVDSQHFLFSLEEDQQMQLGSLNAPATPFLRDPYGVLSVRWLDGERYLFYRQRGELFDLVLGVLGGEEIILDSLPAGAQPMFDFAVSTVPE